MKKKILLRAEGLLPPIDGSYRQGIGRSNYELLNSLCKLNDDDIEFSFYCNQIKRPLYSFKEWSIKHYKSIIPNRLNEFCGMESFWRTHFTKYDLFHITDNYANVSSDEPFVVTIHDMKLYDERPKSRKLFKQMGEWSLGIVTCSNYTKTEIVRYLNVDPEKICVIPWGINHEMFRPQPQERVESIKIQYGIKDLYFFACSCAHPRKNAIDILKAFRLFCESEKDVSLVLTWSNIPKSILEEYQKEIENRQIIILNYVSDDDLTVLYTGALASFLISSLEGFGFPVLESMACGTNCITCSNSSLAEIGGNMAYYVKEHDIDDIISAMEFYVKKGKVNQQELINYSNKYSWHKTALLYMDFYKSHL